MKYHVNNFKMMTGNSSNILFSQFFLLHAIINGLEKNYMIWQARFCGPVPVNILDMQSLMLKIS